MASLLDSGPTAASHRLMIAHGAGARMTSPFLDAIADLLAERGLAVTRFEFGYMREMREGGRRRPPPKLEILTREYEAAIGEVRELMPRGQSLFIGGKSMGGRVASLIADRAFAHGDIAGLVCLGYPFHPPAKPDALRTGHLEALACPALIVQGERDPFGSRAEVEALPLSNAITVQWIGDGDHDLGPRGRSGYTRKGNLVEAADAVAAFVARARPAG